MPTAGMNFGRTPTVGSQHAFLNLNHLQPPHLPRAFLRPELLSGSAADDKEQRHQVRQSPRASQSSNGVEMPDLPISWAEDE